MSYRQALDPGEAEMARGVEKQGYGSCRCFPFEQMAQVLGKLVSRRPGEAHKVVVVQQWRPEEPRNPQEKCCGDCSSWASRDGARTSET